MNMYWLGAVFLAGVVGDPKNAAVEVPRFGDLPLSNMWEETQRVTQEGNSLNFFVPSSTVITKHPSHAPLLPSDGGKTGHFFDDVLSEVNYIAHRWNSDHHKNIDLGYEAELNLGPNPWVRVSVRYKQDGDGVDIQRWVRRLYAPPSPSIGSASLNDRLSPIQRRAVITGKHITMLAMLWADTLKHLDVIAPGSEPPPVDGDQDQTKQSANPQKTKAAGAPPPTASDKLGSPANSRASQHLCRPGHTLSFSPKARAGVLDAIESLQEGDPSNATSEHSRHVERIAC